MIAHDHPFGPGKPQPTHTRDTAIAIIANRLCIAAHMDRYDGAPGPLAMFLARKVVDGHPRQMYNALYLLEEEARAYLIVLAGSCRSCQAILARGQHDLDYCPVCGRGEELR